MKIIQNITVYGKVSEISYLLELHYIIFQKDYLKEKNNQKLMLAI